MTLEVLVDWTRTTVAPQSPTDIPASGFLWWKASDLSTLADGAAVSSWAAAEGTSTASQGTGSKQPTKQTVNGETVVRFDGTNDNLTMNGDALTISQNEDAVTLMVRAKVTPAAATKRILMLSTGTNVNNNRCILQIDAANLLNTGGRRLDADLNELVTGTNPGSTAVRVMTGILDYTNSDAFLYMDGTLTGSDTTFQTAGNTENTASLAAAMGSRADGTTDFMAMDLYEVLIWAKALSTEEREAAESYLRSGGEVTGSVRRQAGMSFEYGRDQVTALAPTVAGRGQFTLDNVTRRYTPRNSSSPLFGLVKPARPVRVARTVSGTKYVLFVGHTDDSPINPDLTNRSVSLSLVDSLADFRGLTISTALYSGIRTGEAMDIILDECGWTGPRDLDNGSTVMPYWWEDNADAFTAMETLVRCEGPPALLTVGTDGGVVFKDRHHRLLDSASITSQGTWRAIGTEPVMNVPFVYDDAWRNIINHGLVSVDVRQMGELQPIWTGDSYIKFSVSETKTFLVNTTDPFKDAAVPVADTDYTFDAGSFSSVTLSRTSGASTTLTMTAGGSGARIRNLQLRARPIQVAYTQQVTASDSSSITDYGQRSFPGDLPFCNIYDAQAVLDTAVEMRSEPLPILTIRFMVGNNTARGTAILPRDLSDRITVVEAETALNNDVYIESIAHEIPNGESEHAVIVGCELVPPDGAVTAANVFIIGGSGAHDIGDGVLAR